MRTQSIIENRQILRKKMREKNPNSHRDLQEGEIYEILAKRGECHLEPEKSGWHLLLKTEEGEKVYFFLDYLPSTGRDPFFKVTNVIEERYDWEPTHPGLKEG